MRDPLIRWISLADGSVKVRQLESIVGAQMQSGFVKQDDSL